MSRIDVVIAIAATVIVLGMAVIAWLLGEDDLD